jgi:hypothetical protein
VTVNHLSGIQHADFLESALLLLLGDVPFYVRAGGRVDGWGTMQQARRAWVQFPMRSLDFSIVLILPGVLGPWGRLSLFLWLKGSRCVRLTTSPPSVPTV